jgi:aryl-alcohol dehydrogenase-like predicted oxidoreductase
VIKNPDLVLGTANFGLNYGVGNKGKKITKPEASRILQEASKLGVKKIDTAMNYGDAESILGNSITSTNQFEVTTKIPAAVFSQPGETLKCIRRSLKKSRQNSYLAVLLHNTSFLNNLENIKLRKELSTLKELGLTLHLGVSVYTEEDIKKSKEFFPEFDFFQILENVCDQKKYNSKYLQDTADQGTTFFIRSIFLQGMLLMNPQILPQSLVYNKESLIQLNKFCELKNISVLDLCVHYAKSIPWAAGVVFGVNSVQHLQEINESYKKSFHIDFSNAPKISKFYLDPRNWT